MNLLSFVDELMKVGAMDPIAVKHASTSESLPVGMVGSDPMPTEGDLIRPDEASSRVPLTSGLSTLVESGALGGMSQAKDPINQPTFNRAYGSGTSRDGR